LAAELLHAEGVHITVAESQELDGHSVDDELFDCGDLKVCLNETAISIGRYDLDSNRFKSDLSFAADPADVSRLMPLSLPASRLTTLRRNRPHHTDVPPSPTNS